VRAVNTRRVMGLASLLVMIAVPAYANIGVPMLAVVWPASSALLLPIIAIEAAIAVKVIGRGWKNGLIVASKANVLSTVLGIPVTWGVLLLLQLLVGGGSAWGIGTMPGKLAAVTVQSPWLIPYEEDLHWMVPAAAAFLCIPFFLMSVWSERWMAIRSLGIDGKKSAGRWAWIANGATYGAIIVCLTIAAVRATR
jgi:hypothetical protein